MLIASLSGCGDGAAQADPRAAGAPGSAATAAPVSAPSKEALRAMFPMLRGDGSEFEQSGASAPEASGAIDKAAPIEEDDGSCCSGGDCVCRGGAPTSNTPNGKGPYSTSAYAWNYSLGRAFGGATVYYPTNAAPPLSGVVMCPGYTALQSSIADWGPFFASHGIVLVTIDTITILDDVNDRANALWDALNVLKAENTRAGSPLRGKLSRERYGLAGWSMGGGGTWIVTRDHPELKSAVTLAGHNLTAGGGLVSLGSTVPTLMLNGALDTSILGGLGQSEASYAAIDDSTPKLLYSMALDDHFSWGTPTTNGNAAGRYVLAWEKVFLEGDTRYRSFLLERGPLAAEWESNLN
jgi:dienelactone hydrolase